MKHNVILRILATITVTTVFFISSNFTIAGTATDPNLNTAIDLSSSSSGKINLSPLSRKSCDNVCTAELTCDYFVTVYPDNEVAFNIGVQNSNDNLVELYCVYQSGLELP